MDRISTFCSMLNHEAFIAPTNPHSFFFSGSPAQQTDQPGLVLSPQAPVSMRHNHPEKRFSSLSPGDLPGAQVPLLLLSDGYGLNQWNKSLRGVRVPRRGSNRFGMLKISGISFQVIKIASFFFAFRRSSIYRFTLMGYSFHCVRGWDNSGRPMGSLRYPISPSQYHVV